MTRFLWPQLFKSTDVNHMETHEKLTYQLCIYFQFRFNCDNLKYLQLITLFYIFDRLKTTLK